MIQPAKKVTASSPKNEKGLWGEQFATKVLQEQGYKIVARNVHSRYGEIDIIAQDKDELVFIEVKLRTNTAFGTPEESITSAKKERLLKTIWEYLDKTGPIDQKETKLWRCDLFVIELSNNHTVRRHEVYKNILSD
jgi:putative endonuclease